MPTQCIKNSGFCGLFSGFPRLLSAKSFDLTTTLSEKHLANCKHETLYLRIPLNFIH